MAQGVNIYCFLQDFKSHLFCCLSSFLLPFSRTTSLQSQEECCIKSRQQWQQNINKSQRPKPNLVASSGHTMPPLTSPCPSISTQPLPPCQARNAGGHWPFHPRAPPWFLRKIRRWWRNWECPIKLAAGGDSTSFNEVQILGLEFHAALAFYALLVWLLFKNVKLMQMQHSSFLLPRLPLWITERSLIKEASPLWQQTVGKHESVIGDFMSFAFELGFHVVVGKSPKTSVPAVCEAPRGAELQGEPSGVHHAEVLIRWWAELQQLSGWQQWPSNGSQQGASIVLPFFCKFAA